MVRRSETKKRRRALEKLGGVCVVCGFGQGSAFDWRALQIDHIDPADAKVPGRASRHNLRKYQLLCANCHQVKGYLNNDHTHHARHDGRQIDLFL